MPPPRAVVEAANAAFGRLRSDARFLAEGGEASVH